MHFIPQNGVAYFWRAKHKQQIVFHVYFYTLLLPMYQRLFNTSPSPLSLSFFASVGFDFEAEKWVTLCIEWRFNVELKIDFSRLTTFSTQFIVEKERRKLFWYFRLWDRPKGESGCHIRFVQSTQPNKAKFVLEKNRIHFALAYLKRRKKDIVFFGQHIVNYKKCIIGLIIL